MIMFSLFILNHSGEILTFLNPMGNLIKKNNILPLYKGRFKKKKKKKAFALIVLACFSLVYFSCPSHLSIHLTSYVAMIHIHGNSAKIYP